MTAPRPVAAATAAGNCTPSSSWPAASSTLAAQVANLINQHRVGLGERPLVTSPTLTASAVWKARHMAAYQYFSHDDPGPPIASTAARTAADRVATCGYRASWGENIATGFSSAQAVFNAWLGSAGHRANIENRSFAAAGIGVATGANGAVYWVQDFGYVADGGLPPPSPPPPATTTAPSAQPAPSQSGSGTGRLGLAVVDVRVAARRLVVVTRVSARVASPPAASVKCAARLGHANLRVVVNTYRRSLARCAWRLPHRVARGTVLRGWIRVREGGVRVRRSFTLKLV